MQVRHIQVWRARPNFHPIESLMTQQFAQVSQHWEPPARRYPIPGPSTCVIAAAHRYLNHPVPLCFGTPLPRCTMDPIDCHNLVVDFHSYYYHLTT